jgi:dienelactone hydrolase
MAEGVDVKAVRIRAGDAFVEAELRIPSRAGGLVIFAHGSGSSRFSGRNRRVALFLETRGFATLLVDLLTRHEETIDVQTAEYRFDIPRLAARVVATIDWAAHRPETASLPVCCFGASTGAAAALGAAAERPERVQAVVSRGGRPDLAGNALPHVKAPTLLIVGGNDEPVIDLNREAMTRMTAHVELTIVPGATHLFEEPGTLEAVCEEAARWCEQYLVSKAVGTP